jgi:2-polyprenyl-3-methyl-5-hydroxy-6-metoxy-1,4-benzoquinol methylase
MRSNPRATLARIFLCVIKTGERQGMSNTTGEAPGERRRNVAAGFHGRLHGYARLKLRYDPVYPEVADRIMAADAPVLDIGSGIGLFGLYLHEHGFRNRYYGIDCDAEKISQARRSASERAAPLTFETRDALVLPPFSGSVVLLDVLHYMDRDRQRVVLRSAARRVAERGTLVIRTALKEPAWRYRATVCEEWLLHGCGWMQMRAQYFPQRAEIESTLQELGMQVTTRPLWGRTPFASFLIVGRRPALA